MGLQFALASSGGQRVDVFADVCQSFDVRVEHYGSDKAARGANCYANIHHMVPGQSHRKQKNDIINIRWLFDLGLFDNMIFFKFMIPNGNVP